MRWLLQNGLKGVSQLRQAQLRRLASSAAGGSSSQLKWAGLGTAAVTCAAAAFTLARAEPAGVVVLPEPAHPVSQHLEDTVDWVHELAGQPDVQQVLTAQTMQHHSVLKHDHLFSSLLRHEVVKDLVCFYAEERRRFYCVMQLGADVCGYPRVVHGGLTAAILDESFGFLLYALKHHNQLPFWQPAFTAHLEVDYKAKMQAGRLVVCEVELESIEGRKLWMRGEVRDRPGGKVYATSRALFVVPRTASLFKQSVKYVLSTFMPRTVSVE